MRNRPLICKLILFNAVSSNFVAILWATFQQKNGSVDIFYLGVLLTFSIILMITAVFKYVTDTISVIRIALIVQIISLFFILPIIHDFIIAQFLLINSVLSEIAIY